MSRIEEVLKRISYRQSVYILGVYPATLHRWKNKVGGPDVGGIVALLRFARAKRLPLEFADIHRHWKKTYDKSTPIAKKVPRGKAKTLSSKSKE